VDILKKEESKRGGSSNDFARHLAARSPRELRRLITDIRLILARRARINNTAGAPALYPPGSASGQPAGITCQHGRRALS